MKFKNIIVALLIVLINFSGFSQKENVKKAVKKAVRELKNDKSDYINAIKIYEKVVEDSRIEDEDLFIKIAKSYYFNSNYSKAAKWFGKYYKIDNTNPLPIYDYWYGQSLKVLNKYRKADLLLAPYYQSKGERYIYSVDNLKTIPNNIDRYEILPFKYNTPFSDYSAYLHKDRLYFITSISNGNKLGWVNKTTSDIFFLDDSNVEVQKPYGSLNSKFNEGSLVITKDGKTMYFTRNAFLKNKYKKNKKGEPRTIALNIYRAELIDLKWENITPLSINNPNYSVGHPALSADEKTLYFSSDMPGGKGLTDLYSVSINENGSLGKPKNLEALNTIGKEMFPFVDQKTDILYFSSDRPSSLGGLDVFLSRLESDETYKSAHNIGKPINSSFDDFGYMINAEKRGYFSSNKREEVEEESDDVEDQLDEIYSFVETAPFSFPIYLKINGVVRDIETKDLVSGAKISLFDNYDDPIQTVLSDANGQYIFSNTDVSKARYVRTEKRGYLTVDTSLDAIKLANKDPKLDIDILPVLPNQSETIRITGRVKDENATKQNRDISGAKITLYDINAYVLETKNTNKNGIFSVYNINRKDVAFLRIEKEGYLTEEIAINGNKVIGDTKHLGNIFLSTSRIANKAGEDIASILNTIYFDYGKSAIREDAKIELEKIVQVLSEYKDIEILIGSHTDSRGAKVFNQKLSQRRAKSTYDYLVSRGISSSRLSYKGYGEYQLINRCKDGVKCSEEEYQLNRRSSFTIRK